MFPEDSFDGAGIDAVAAGELGLGDTSGRVGMGDGVALVGGESVGGGLGSVGVAVDEAFDASDTDAVFGGEVLLAGAGVEGGDEGVAVGGGEANVEGPRGCWRVGDGGWFVGSGGHGPGFGAAGRQGAREEFEEAV